MKKFTLFCCTFFMTLSSFSREVDHFMSWGHDLKDSGELLDKYFISTLEKSLEIINKDRIGFGSCEKTALQLTKISFFDPGYQLIERWAEEDSKVEKYPPYSLMNRSEYLKKSIYRNQIAGMPMSRVINTHGVYIGTDKLGHFTVFGMRYFSSYRKLIKKGMSESQAIEEVVQKGMQTEDGAWGLISTGVFSSADLEANYQGLLFMIGLCKVDHDGIQLVKKNKKWTLKNKRDFSLKNYINPNWDESYFPSFFSQKEWNKDIVNVIPKYCDKRKSQWVLDLFKKYDQMLTGPTFVELEIEKFKDQDAKITEHGLLTFDKFCLGK